METQFSDYRKKWRMRREQIRNRRLPFIVGGVLLVIAVAIISAHKPRPQLAAVAWAHGDGSRGMPYLALGEGVLAVVWEYGTVTAHDPATGRALWPSPFDRASQFDASAAIGENRVVLGAADGYVRCLNLKNGEIEGAYDAQTHLRSPPVVLDNRVYIGGDNGRLYCLTLANQLLVWAYPPSDEADREPILGSPAIAKRTIAFGTCEGIVSALNVDTGKLRWQSDFGGPVVARVTALDECFYAGAESGIVRCLEAQTGTVRWEKRYPAMVRQPVLVYATHAYVVTSQGWLYCMDRETGADLWRRHLDGRPTTSMAADERSVYIGTSEGRLTALTHSSGRVVWQWRPEAKPLGELLIDAKHLYCTTANARLFAVRLDK
ncbi:MAG: outer membrane protein assembly factor BamB family protein [Candidatus Zipacnadales bacterium]